MNTRWQARLLAAVAVVTGYGLVFGIMDLEDAPRGHALRVLLQQETRICYPIGAFAGALAAVTARVIELRGLDELEWKYLVEAAADRTRHL